MHYSIIYTLTSKGIQLSFAVACLLCLWRPQSAAISFKQVLSMLVGFLASFCCRKREKRKMEESLKKVKTLGQADEDVDDLAKWVTKSRTREEEDKELARAEALAAERRQAEEVCLHAATNHEHSSYFTRLSICICKRPS